MSKTVIRRRVSALIRHEDAVAAELRRLYPEGSEVYVVLGERQAIPSRAEVIGHPGGKFGLLCVRLLDTPRMSVRDVGFERVLDARQRSSR